MRLLKPTPTEYAECLDINYKSFVGEELAPDGIFLNAWNIGNIFVEKLDGRIIGFAIVTRQNGVAYLWVIAVKPEFRGKGVAGNLLYEIWLACQSMNERAIELTVKSTNPAQKLYFDAGYRVVKFLRGFYLGGGDGLLMRRMI